MEQTETDYIVQIKKSNLPPRLSSTRRSFLRAVCCSAVCFSRYNNKNKARYFEDPTQTKQLDGQSVKKKRENVVSLRRPCCRTWHGRGRIGTAAAAAPQRSRVPHPPLVPGSPFRGRWLLQGRPGEPLWRRPVPQGPLPGPTRDLQARHVHLGRQLGQPGTATEEARRPRARSSLTGWKGR